MQKEITKKEEITITECALKVGKALRGKCGKVAWNADWESLIALCIGSQAAPYI